MNVKQPLVQQSLERLRVAKLLIGDLYNDRKEHNCSLDFCNPQNEPSLIEQGYLKGPALTDCVYLCRYGQFHVCTTDQCTECIEGVCPVSGRCHGVSGTSVYDATDARTWYANTTDARRGQGRQTIYNVTETTTTTTKKRRVRRRQVTITTVCTTMENIVIQLLYDRHRRESLNEQNKQDAAKKLQKRLDAYKTDCNLQKVPINELDLKILHFNTTYIYMEILTYDINRILRYKDVITHIYQLFQRNFMQSEPQRQLLRTLALGTLYAMRTGFKHDDVYLLPKDEYLCLHLPKINDLPHFGIEKKHITSGVQLLKQIYNASIDAGLAITDLTFMTPLNVQEITFFKSKSRKK